MSNKLITQDLIDLLIVHYDLKSEDAEKFIIGLFDLIQQRLSYNGSVQIKDLGTFQLTSNQKKKSVDTNTWAKTSQHQISFTPAQSLEKLINKPFAHFETTLLNDGIVLENIEQDDPSESIDIEEENLAKKTDKSIDKSESADNLEFPAPVVLETKIESLNTSEPDDSKLDNINSVEVEEDTNLDVSDETTSPDVKPPIDTPVKSTSDRKRKRSFLWLYILMALFAVFVIVYSYNFYVRTDYSGKENIEEGEIPKPIQEITPIIRDTLTTPQPSPPVHTAETVEMTRGKTLRIIALDKLGSREFWVYIYLKNKDKVENPDVVPLGLELVLPCKSEYPMDSKNPQDVENAKKLGDKEMKKFW